MPRSLVCYKKVTWQIGDVALICGAFRVYLSRTGMGPLRLLIEVDGMAGMFSQGIAERNVKGVSNVVIGTHV
jgi:hypothetical protein